MAPDIARADHELAINVRKATTADETAPKRKHVRCCIVHTWDHRSSMAFWTAMKVQPLLADEIQTFKALITVHRVLQEGFPGALKEAMPQRTWIESLDRAIAGDGVRGYAPLIHEYVRYLLSKLAFHHHHPDFNGTFEYEEYVSLKATNDPNEGYESVSDLMTLQDKIHRFQGLIFSHLRNIGSNECRISALVPLVQESIGIYRFITSMLRAMHTSLSDPLSPLRQRYDAQHYRLVKFYYECSNLRYLTSLIAVPQLSDDPPNLLPDDPAPSLPARPPLEIEKKPTPPPTAPDDPDDIAEFWQGEIDRQNREYEEQQRILDQRAQQHAFAQQQASLQAQRNFELQQRRLMEQQQLDHQALLAQQAGQTQGRLAELERENLGARAQYQQDQLMLQQFDQRVKALEGELQQVNEGYGSQVTSRDHQIGSLREQVDTWRAKYEALAKLYSQLRREHLDLLAKFKAAQLKAASAHEAIDRREKLERELKTKNLELADMIRDRDRATHDRDRLVGSNKDEVERLKRELRLVTDQLEDVERRKGNELSAMLTRYNREVADLEEALRGKRMGDGEKDEKLGDAEAQLRRKEDELREKDEELDVYKAGMDQTLLQLNHLSLSSQPDPSSSIIDPLLQSGIARVDDALYELDSNMQAGNQKASPPYVLSHIEKASASATEFATAFNNFVADGPAAPLAHLIKSVGVFAGAMADVCGNTKGLGLADDGPLAAARQSALSAVRFFRALQSFRLEGMDPVQKTDVVINGNNDVQVSLQRLNKLLDSLAPVRLDSQGDLGDIVDRELTKAADAIAAAAARVAKLKNKPRQAYTTYELHVHDSILSAAAAITDAITRLVRAAAATQREIVQAGRGSASRTAFYKKNNRWTEGLVSAAKAVAASTNVLIETADGVLSAGYSPERLIVASNDAAASTAQLVAASRVKAGFMTATQDELEHASRAVGAACRALVRQVQDMIKEREEPIDFSALGPHDFKIREMEQQVRILQLENDLSAARHQLGEMRKLSYQEG